MDTTTLKKKLGYDDHQDWQPLNNFYFCSFFLLFGKTLYTQKHTHPARTKTKDPVSLQ